MSGDRSRDFGPVLRRAALLLPSGALEAVERARPSLWHFTVASTPDDLIRRCLSGGVDAAVVAALAPPLGLSTREEHQSVRHVTRRARTPVVVLTEPSLIAMKAMVQLWRDSPFPCSIAILPPSGRVEGLSEALSEAVEWHVSTHAVLALKHSAKSDLPFQVDRVLWDIFRSPGEYQQATAIEGRGISAAIMNAALRHAGFASFRNLRQASRVAATYQMIRYQGASLRDIAHCIGSVSEDTVERDCKLITGLPAGRMARELSVPELTARLCAACVAPMRVRAKPSRHLEERGYTRRSGTGR